MHNTYVLCDVAFGPLGYLWVLNYPTRLYRDPCPGTLTHSPFHPKSSPHCSLVASSQSHPGVGLSSHCAGSCHWTPSPAPCSAHPAITLVGGAEVVLGPSSSWLAPPTSWGSLIVAVLWHRIWDAVFLNLPYFLKLKCLTTYTFHYAFQPLSINKSGKYYPTPSARTDSLKTSSTACAELVLWFSCSSCCGAENNVWKALNTIDSDTVSRRH